jgi:hypothetical protein
VLRECSVRLFQAYFVTAQFGFVICGSTAAGVSPFVAAIRPWLFVPDLFSKVAVAQAWDGENEAKPTSANGGTRPSGDGARGPPPPKTWLMKPQR